jgi:hypothetical protein
MLRKIFTTSVCLFLAASSLAATGCFVPSGPGLGLLSIPIPVSPYFQQMPEEEFWVQERYARVPILGPNTYGNQIVALDEPSDDEVMRALERARPVQGGFPFLNEKQRNNVTIVKEKISDYIDPPRHIPLIGPAQLHHAHYKCTIYMSERTINGYPAPHMLEDDEVVEVIYVDHNHFHIVGNVTGNVPGGISSNY